MRRWEASSVIARTQVVGIVRMLSPHVAVETGRVLLETGLDVVEIALTTPGGLRAVEELAARAPAGSLVGAGTVLDAVTARLAVDAGAAFLVCPHLARDVVATGHRYGVPVLPGAVTPTEILEALEAGADMVKLFPAASLGLGHLRAVLAAIPQASLVPTGGIHPGNAAEWLAAGATAVGVGGALTGGSPADTRAAMKALLAAVAQ